MDSANAQTRVLLRRAAAVGWMRDLVFTDTLDIDRAGGGGVPGGGEGMKPTCVLLQSGHPTNPTVTNHPQLRSVTEMGEGVRLISIASRLLDIVKPTTMTGISVGLEMLALYFLSFPCLFSVVLFAVDSERPQGEGHRAKCIDQPNSADRISNSCRYLTPQASRIASSGAGLARLVTPADLEDFRRRPELPVVRACWKRGWEGMGWDGWGGRHLSPKDFFGPVRTFDSQHLPLGQVVGVPRSSRRIPARVWPSRSPANGIVASRVRLRWNAICTWPLPAVS